MLFILYLVGLHNTKLYKLLYTYSLELILHDVEQDFLSDLIATNISFKTNHSIY